MRTVKERVCRSDVRKENKSAGGAAEAVVEYR
jgi:hypothetical protein